MSETASYRVPGIHCAHCQAAITDQLTALDGVDSAEVDLDTKIVLVHGRTLDDARLRAAIEEAGYEAD
jgi:copper chaperone